MIRNSAVAGRVCIAAVVGVVLSGGLACSGEGDIVSKPSRVASPSSPPPLPPPPPPPPGIDARLAFESTRDGTRAIYVATEDGSEIRRLTDGERPVWSPDGREIAFHNLRSCLGSCQIYVMNADGSGLRFLGAGFSPSWSPDGLRIAFRSPRADGLFVMNRDGSSVKLLVSAEQLKTPGFPGDLTIEYPRWTPDGRISFVRTKDPDDFDPWTLHAVRPDGSGLQTLNVGRCEVDQLDWSPDGTRLACIDFVFGLGVGLVTGNGLQIRVPTVPDTR